MADREKPRYIFGPVPSRRLGRSLGVDLVPLKVCTYDCLYCQVGHTSDKTVRREDYVPVKTVLTELRERLAAGVEADYVTLSGSGEPTLNLSIGRVIEAIREMTDIPVAVLTNGSLFHDRRVRAACSHANVLLPTLAAGSEEVYQRVHRPARGLTLKTLVSGLAAFRRAFAGEIWLEVFVLAGINDSDAEMCAIRRLAERIRPDRIQLNTAVRPTAQPEALAVDRGRLDELSALFSPNGEVIAEFSTVQEDRVHALRRDDILAMVQRRPCTVEDIAGGLGVHRNEVMKYVSALLVEGILRKERRGEQQYYVVREAGAG